MADQGRSVDCTREMRRNSCGDVELTAADTECAHALLDLAHSFSRCKPQTATERAVLYPLTSNRSPPRKLTLQKLPLNKTPALKTVRARELKAVPRDLRTVAVPREAGHVAELEARVLLDHPYALPPWAREYPRPVDPEFFSLLDAVEGSEEARPRDASVSAGQWSERVKEQRENSPAPLRRMNFYAERAADGRSPTPADRQERPPHAGMPESGDTRQQLYEPDDSKYKNFNLLLKCLTTGNDSPPEARSGGRKRCYSTMECEAGSGVAAAAERGGPREVGSSQEARCLHCKKVFSNRAYLKKHTQRMHPAKPEPGRNGPSKSEGVRSGLVTCRRCELRVDAARWSRHRIACGAGAPDHMTAPSRDSASRERLLAASNQSTCQFCGLRMRRQLLVRHLADTHCLDGRAHAHTHGHPHDSANSDSGSETTLSGSEQESEDIVTCDVCLAYVPKPLLHQHVLDQHQRLPEHQLSAGPLGHASRDRNRHSSGYGTDTRARGTSASTETGETAPQLITSMETSAVEIQHPQSHLETSEAASQLTLHAKPSKAVVQPRGETSKAGEPAGIGRGGVVGSGRGGLMLPGSGEPCGQYMLQRYLREHTQQTTAANDSGYTDRLYERNMASNVSPHRGTQPTRKSLSPKNNMSENPRSASGFGRYYDELDVSPYPAELPEYARPAFLAQRPRVPSHAN